MSNIRNTNYKKQLKISFIYKILTILLSFIIVRYSLEYLGIETYGLWSVILVFINWLIFFDFGIANGLKNQISKSLSNGNIQETQSYISTGYLALLMFSITVYAILFITSYFIDWQLIFNTKLFTSDYLQNVILVTSFFILINFVLSIIVAIFNATQNASLIILNQFLSQAIALFIIYLILIYSTSNVLYIAISYGFSLVLSNLLVSFVFYSKNIDLIPKIKSFDKHKIKSILSLGIKFFILQITVLIIMSSDRMIAIQLLSASDVTNYDLLYKYFSTLLILHSLINAPLWSMYTEAFHKKDYKWIKNILIKLNMLLIIYLFCSVIMILFGEEIIYMWTGNSNIKIGFMNYVFMAGLIITMIWSSIYAYFLNGIEKLNIQLTTTILGAIVNIPLSIYLVKYQNMGLNGILLASILSMLIFNIAGTLQTYYIIRKWNND